jgi:hypothetical protein
MFRAASARLRLSATAWLAAGWGWAALAGTPAHLPADVTCRADGARAVCVFDLPELSLDGDVRLNVATPGLAVSESTGEPVLPDAVVVIPLPAGAAVTSCTVTPDLTLADDWPVPVRHGRAASPYSRGPGPPAEPDPSIYALHAAWPPLDPPDWTVERRDGQARLVVHLRPVQVMPASGRLLLHGRLTVDAAWSLPAPLGGDGGGAAAPAPEIPGPLGGGSPLPSSNRYDYVVITSQSLLQTPPPFNFQELCAARSRGGLAATNVTVEWIYANYAGTRPDGGTDNATRVRGFIADARANWGTRYVLLGGTAYSPVIVPARVFTGVVVTASGPFRAFIGADMYYACLDGTFDGNSNGVYGESSDGPGGTDVDLLSEVFVGRIPVANTAEVSRLVRKTLSYEAADPETLRRTCHMGEYIGFGGISDYASTSMEQLRLGGSYDGYSTAGFGNTAFGSFFDNAEVVYDTPTYAWPNSEALRHFNGPYHVFNHLGHGNWYYDFKLNIFSDSDLGGMRSLTNSSYFLAYSQACLAGRFDDCPDCFAETLITATNGPVALMMNSREGWGVGNSTDSPSQRYQRRFWDELLSGRTGLLGPAHQNSRETLRHQIADYGGAMRWCYFGLTLFGDPALPFAARASPLPAQIVHAPLANQAETTVCYRVNATLGPPGIYDPDTPAIVWRTNLAPDIVHTDRLAQVWGTAHWFDLPAVPMDTRVFYRLTASTRAGLAAALPADGSEYSFRVAPFLPLAIGGQPGEYGAVAPPYGAISVISGNTVQASASWREVLPGGLLARRCTGWIGGGSVPASGTSNQVAFRMDRASTLVWLWTNECLLAQSSLPPGLLATNVWLDEGSVAATVLAPASRAAGGTNCNFAGWYVDGIRQPASGRAANPAAGLVMSAPRAAVALYVPAAEDADADGLPDWWELFCLGTTANGPSSDGDADGWSLLDEYRDRTDPADPASRPAPPEIALAPVPAVQGVPPPYTVTAVITDTSPLVATQLVWRRNAGPWQTNAMAAAVGVTNGFQSAVPAPGAPGDAFAWCVRATDSAGLSAQSETVAVFLQYPLLIPLPPFSRGHTTAPPALVWDTLAISNAGNAALVWRGFVGWGEYADALPPDWNLAAGAGSAWTWTTGRCSSAPASFRAAFVSPVPYNGNSQHARADTPPLALGSNAVLRFRHWIASELNDYMPAIACWDGGIVEISTNGGASFAQLPGPYDHVITGWQASPWPDGTPCFAGSGGGWREATFDLAAHAGRTAILRFHYGGDDNTDREGWYVDDVRVAPLAAPAPAGAALGPSADTLAAGGSQAMVAAVDTAAFARRWLRLPVRLTSNDPVAPDAWYDLAFETRRPPLLAVSAAQSTNGDGRVAVTGSFVDPDAEPRTLSFQYSCDDGATWKAPRFGAPSFGHGGAALRTNEAALDWAPLAGEPGFATNSFALSWDTCHPSNDIALAMRTLLRAAATDPLFPDVQALAGPFAVDNQAPPAPGLQVFTHLPQAWSAARGLLCAWNASDGAGTGIQGQELRFWRPGEGGGTNLSFGATPPLLAGVTADADASNWWLQVTVRDAAGNAAAASAGPFWIDATAPDVSGASLTTLWGRYGAYVVGAPVVLICTNASDAVSGIAAYRFDSLTQPGAGVLAVPTNRANWSALAWGATNTFRVVVADAAGNVAGPLWLDVLAIASGSDADGDGISAGKEELVGTSPFVASPRFAVTGAGAQAGGLSLQWPGTAGSRYTVEGAAGLAGAAWAGVPGLVDIPGSNGTMSASVPAGGWRFLRVRVSR